MKRRHLMPFGAEVDTEATRFRLWAPGAKRVDVELTQSQVRLSAPMHAIGAGWHEASIPGAVAGTRYAFRIDESISVPDPASRFNPEDVHAASAVVDPLAFDWPDAAWCGRPWCEAVIYELHVGAFTPAGTFAAAIRKLDYLVDLGITAIELMPIADFPGKHNWGYDAVLPYAPDASYGSPEDLKRLIVAAHARGLMIFLDVVYNHFGPEGNYLHLYAPDFFNPLRKTPWGAAINFDGEDSRPIRDFFIHNALYWLEEYCFDGLRLDAVHTITDQSQPDLIVELSAAVRAGPGVDRHVHIIIENDANESRYLYRSATRHAVRANAQWNDDVHHALHVLVTNEHEGYYADYAERPHWLLGRALAEGFGFQGEPSRFRGGAPRGTSSTHLDASAFINFIQNHDQVGNRALGERIAVLAGQDPMRVAVACLLLAPTIPMLFMGEEFAAETPFLFFCDFGPELAQQVRVGRRREFEHFAQFRDPEARLAIPDPNDPATFRASKLAWNTLDIPSHRAWHALYRQLLDLRQRFIVPRLPSFEATGQFQQIGATGIAVDWAVASGGALHLRANFSALPLSGMDVPRGQVIFATHPVGDKPTFAPWTAIWTLETASE